MVTNEWLNEHAVEFLLYNNNGPGESLQIPSKEIWDLFSNRAQSEGSLEDAIEHSRKNDARFVDKIYGVIGAYSGGVIQFDQWELSRVTEVVKIKVEQEETVTDSKKDLFRDAVRDVVVDGAKGAVVGQAGDLAMDAFKHLFAGNEAVSAALENEMAAEASKLMVALATYYISKEYPDLIPKNDHVGAVCEILIRDSTKNIVQPNLAVLSQYALEMAKIGEKLSDDTKTSFVVEEEEVFELKEEVKREPAVVGNFREETG